MVRIVAEPQSMSSHPEGTEVQVKVIGPRVSPDGAKELRARAQALVVAGPAHVARKSVENVTAGEIDRYTEVEDVITRNDPDFLNDLIPVDIDLPRKAKMEAKLYTIVVKDK